MSACKGVSLLSKYGSIDLKLINWYPLCSSVLNTIGSQQVRYRKARWLPKAPSKIFVVTHRRRLPPREMAENLRLYQNHKFFLRLTYDFLAEENMKKSSQSEHSIMMQELEEIEHRELMKFNDKENKRMMEIRNNQLNVDKEKLLEDILEFKQMKDVELTKTIESELKRIATVEDLVKTFIDIDDLEKAIEHAIDHPKDYNFSVDLTGRMFEGRNTLPHLVDVATMPVLAVIDEGLTNEIL